ncbi:Transcription initiation factor IIB-like [Oopsacas minuta]|uniref:Transcription initiation factor IIB n=1 Tax=Oopsacas minuta TaxID=111878 RepID=A0AAV7K486_9METZ|nr:Transcription initiation factor IIB-like [Oopsacas minuta]
MACQGSQSDKLSCPQHPNAILVEDYRAGDMICPLCGMVIGDRVVDVGTEWRTFTGDLGVKDRSRVGAAESSLLKSGGELTTVMDISYGQNEQYASWAINSNSAGATDKGLKNGLREISIMADRIRLPKVIIDQAQTLFHQVHDEKLIRGRSYDAVAAACLFIACRQEDVPRSFKEICSISRFNKKDIGRCFKHLKRVLPQFAQPGSNAPANSPEKFMSRFCSNLGLPSNVEKMATHIAQSAEKRNIAPGRVYLSIYATAIYMAAIVTGFKKSVKEIHDAVGVAEGTIRHIYKEVYRHRVDIFPDSIQFKEAVINLPLP